MKFRTEIQIPAYPFSVSHQDKLFFTGSCFTLHLGNYLKDVWMQTEVNPFGTLFNPFSVCRLLERSMQLEWFGENEVFFHQNTWKSIFLPTGFNRPAQHEFLENANATLENVHKTLQEANIIFITLGTAQLYIHTDTEDITANCQKLPADKCKYHLAGTKDIINVLSECIDKLSRFGQEKHIVFTISPVRYLQQGFSENLRSKSRLVEAVFSVKEKFKNVYYFPAYEIFTDDLRDYRFYDSDLIHPGEQGIQYTLEKFQEAFFKEKTKEIVRRIEKINKSLRHRPMGGNRKEQEKFLTDLKEKLVAFKQDYPEIQIPEFVSKRILDAQNKTLKK